MSEDEEKHGGSPKGVFSRPPDGSLSESRPRRSSDAIPRGTISSAQIPRAPSSPPGPASGSDAAPVLDDIAANESLRDDEGSGGDAHDGWTAGIGAKAGNSTIPPPRTSEVERLREMSAMETAPMPGGDEGEALNLVDRSRPSVELDLEGEMQDCYALDDLTGALRFAELILGRDPGNTRAQEVAGDCRVRLQALYSSKIGDLSRVVELAMGDAEVRWLGLDHRSGFLLSRIDGVTTVEELLDVCGMPRLEALKTLAELFQRGAIRLQDD